METRVFLIRHGATEWHNQKRVLGRRDLPLSERGTEDARRTADALASVKLSDVISSPLQRAIQSAEIIASKHQIQVARDPRLNDFDTGQWSGMTYDEVSANPDYQRFLANPAVEQIPGGETLGAIESRAVSAIEQALADSPSGDAIAVVTHAGIIRILLAHYLGAAPGNYHRIRVGHGSISVLSFTDDRELPRILATNYLPSLSSALGL